MCDYGGEYDPQELDDILYQHPLAPYTNGDSEVSSRGVASVQ